MTACRAPRLPYRCNRHHAVNPNPVTRVLGDLRLRERSHPALFAVRHSHPLSFLQTFSTLTDSKTSSFPFPITMVIRAPTSIPSSQSPRTSYICAPDGDVVAPSASHSRSMTRTSIQ